MIKRYENPAVSKIWADPNKLALWQETELAVIQAMVNLAILPEKEGKEISRILQTNQIDLDWWLEKEKEFKHDLNAFLAERLRFLPLHLQSHFHKNLTSYDTEEPAFAGMLRDSVQLVQVCFPQIETILINLALNYRYTIMMGRTHGQEAELQTFGKRCLTWLQDIRVSSNNLRDAAKNLKYSKISGAIGNYASMDPAIETEALKILGFKPYYGATQIMPREFYAPVAEALCQIVMTLDKIATAIRLGARSGRPIYQEPFGKKQTGSSRMPQKKNTISTEQVEGMARMAKGFFFMIMDNIKTWEERAIEQSCVERVAWPDLFHVTIRTLETMTRVLKGLAVYPDNMLMEVIGSRGCYAAGEAKEFLRETGASLGLSTEGAYRIIQLAAFIVFEPGDVAGALRKNPLTSFADADQQLRQFQQTPRTASVSIQEIIKGGQLRCSLQLEITESDVQKWNDILRRIFESETNITKWSEVFSVPLLLRHEERLYREILSV